jgi:hypothetical protein
LQPQQAHYCLIVIFFSKYVKWPLSGRSNTRGRNADNTAGTTSVVRKVVDAYNEEVLKRSLKKRTAPETQ